MISKLFCPFILILLTTCSTPPKRSFIRSLASEKLYKVGIYTGSFDPPHIGHKNIVEEFKRLHNLDGVIIVPDQNFGYKPNMTDSQMRDEMLRAMFKGEAWAEIPSPEELKDFGAADLWDIYEYFEEKYPENRHFGMMGTDTFEWYKDAIPEESLEKTSGIGLLVNQRKGQEINLPKALGGQEITSVKIADQGYSSSAIRKKIANAQKPEELPESVWKVVKKYALYGLPSRDLQNTPCGALLRSL